MYQAILDYSKYLSYIHIQNTFIDSIAICVVYVQIKLICLLQISIGMCMV